MAAVGQLRWLFSTGCGEGNGVGLGGIRVDIKRRVGLDTGVPADLGFGSFPPYFGAEERCHLSSAACA